MPKRLKKTTGSFVTTPKSSRPDREPSKIPSSEIHLALEAALAEEDYPRALELLDTSPGWVKKQPEVMLIRATVLISLGDDLESLRILREIERKNPRFTAHNLPLALLYMSRDWLAHALQTAKRAISDRELSDEGRASLSEIIEEGSDFIQHLAAEFDLPFETMQRAISSFEKAQMAMADDKLSEAEYFAKEAIKIAPDWNFPHKVRAQALYFQGKTTEAVTVLEEALAGDAGNISILSLLVIFYFGMGQTEQALDYASRIEDRSKKITIDSLEIEDVITIFALVENTPSLWKIAKRALDASPDSLTYRSWYSLAVAAVRHGRWIDALKLIEKIDKDELMPAWKQLRDELEVSARKRQMRLAWMPPAYPAIDLFIHSKVMAEWDALLKNYPDSMTPSQKRKFDSFFQKYPFMVAVFKRLLWEETGHPVALQILLDMETPQADAEILRFALSDVGPLNTRTQVILMLVQSGRYTGPKNVKMWNDDLREWREVELNTQRIDDVEIKILPKAQALMEQAYKTKDPQAAIALLQKAIELDPTCPIPFFNLGVMLAQNGKDEEGEALIKRSIEVDPNYTYGHASIALSEADKGNEQEALDHLEVVTRAEVIAPATAFMTNLAWASLAIQKHDLKSARQRFELAAQISPDHHLLDHYEDILKEADALEEKFGFLFEYERESKQRAHQKLLKTPLTAEMGLLACLETNTKDMLVGSAYFLQTSSSGKKGELASRLAQLLLDAEFLQQILNLNLEKKELEALRWMLEAGGVRPWTEFVRKYGDDREESTNWNYHEPDSIPGRLRLAGLLFSGTLDGQQVAFIPADLRPLLMDLLKYP